MEQDVSFILLIVAGVILLVLLVYSLKTRVRPGRYTELEHNVLGPGERDENDILSMPLNSPKPHQEPYIKKEILTTAIEDEILEAESAAEDEAGGELVNVSEKVIEEAPVEHSKLIILNVLPQEGRKFIGYELLQALLSANLRHGAMSIFHRHESAMGEGKILFSVAQVTEPGTFNLDAMGSCQCSGLTMFMQLTGPEHDLKAYEIFIRTAQQIADNLRGVLVDKKRDALTAESTKRFKSQVQAHLQSINLIISRGVGKGV
jgi:cell division protein ZipA